jgi:hypothetical protein
MGKGSDGCKTPPRRRAKRPLPPDRKPLDEDLHELAEVLAEVQLDTNSRGWFLPVWRDGWNAVELAFEIWQEHYEATAFELERGISRYFKILKDRKQQDTPHYLQIVDDLTAISLHGETQGRKMIAASLRCYQVLVSNSSGGGTVYNDILESALSTAHLNDAIANSVMQWRCLDAIGTTITMRQDANDRLRRAFKTAWSRGLYLAAYALPRAVDFSKKPTLVIT